MIRQRHIKIDTSKIPSPSLGKQSIDVPGLDNYAITGRGVVLVNGKYHLEGEDFLLETEQNKLIWNASTNSYAIDHKDNMEIQFSCHGIIDLEKYFAFINDKGLIKAAAHLCEEMDKAIQEEMWLSACAVAGGLLEAILLGLVKKKKPSVSDRELRKFEKLLEYAIDETIVTTADGDICKEIIRIRHSIHADNFVKNLVEQKSNNFELSKLRSNALRSLSLIERLIDKNWV